MSEETQSPEDVLKKLKTLLDENQQFPTEYIFKFIVPHTEVATLKAIIKHGHFLEKPSRTGKYISVTVTLEMSSSDEIIEMYKRVAVVEGLISL